jgi:hypothetical protein
MEVTQTEDRHRDGPDAYGYVPPEWQLFVILLRQQL